MTEIEWRDDGLYWPVSDTACYEWTQVEIDACDVIISACKSTRSMISAGANVGAYAKQYAKTFETVYAFEPDTTNFKCLALNTSTIENVLIYQAVLGNHNIPTSLTNAEESNCGTFTVNGVGKIPCFKIDQLGLDDLDLIHLDVEGYEYFVLQGAVDTIKRCKPVIALEWLEHTTKFSVSSTQILEFLHDLNYAPKGKVGSDLVFTYQYE